MNSDQKLKDSSAGEEVEPRINSIASAVSMGGAAREPSIHQSEPTPKTPEIDGNHIGNQDRSLGLDEQARASDAIAEMSEQLSEAFKRYTRELRILSDGKQFENGKHLRVDDSVRSVQRSVTNNPITPVFILAPPRSFSSVVGTMIGQHPQTYGLPELELFAAETIAEWWQLCSKATFPRAHGSLRAVAELFFGAQTEETVNLARGWLRRRSHMTTGYFLELLAHQVWPRIPVEKSTSIVYDRKFMNRAAFMFPNARFIHLVRHPRGQGESVMKFLNEREQQAPVRANHWMRRLASYDGKPRRAPGHKHVAEGEAVDPQRAWLALHRNICQFLEKIPEHRRLRVRGEAILTDPDNELRKIAGWLGLRTDAEAIDQMKHPERSVYACFGPPGAKYGNDRFFLEDPKLRPGKVKPLTLEGPLDWRSDGLGFSTELKRLAGEFGYE